MQDLFTTVTLPICGGLLGLAGLILAQSRAIRSELREAARERAALRDRMDNQIGDLRNHVDNQIGNLRDRMDSQNGDLRDRMGRIEGSLDTLQQFFIGEGRGTTA